LWRIADLLHSDKPRLLNGACDVTQAAASARILYFASAETSLDFRLDPIRETCATDCFNVLENIIPRVVEAVAEWNRVFGFLDAHPHLYVRLVKRGFTGEIDNIASGCSAERKRSRCGYAGVISHKALHS
jgi:hypothetical protein